MDFNIDYLIGIGIVILSGIFLYKKIKKNLQKGKCASCPVYEECEKEKKADITSVR